MAETRTNPKTDHGRLEASLPFLPGNNFNIDHELPNQRKSHAFDYKNGLAISHSPTHQIGGQLAPADLQQLDTTSAELYRQLNQEYHARDATNTNFANAQVQPAWVAFDKKVLRFQAYEEEPVNGVSDESIVIRKFQIYFYLEDDSIHVSEPRVANSGFPQGTIIRRHRIPHQNASGFFTVNDFNVGETVNLYARNFHIVSCDEFTRNFLTNTIHKKVPENSIAPEGSYEQHRKEILSRMKATRAYQPNLSLAKFLANDRQVLRFDCVWDDSATPFGDVRNLTLHYFLADDTVEISEHVDSNSGRTPFRLKRSVLPKPAANAAATRTARGAGQAALADANAYKDKDLAIGSVIDCYGRAILILGCDDFTKKFFREKYGLTNMDSIVFQPARDHNNHEYALPHANSASSNPFSIPAPHAPAFHAPRSVDAKGVVVHKEDLSSVQLRFLAKLETSLREDADREFVLTYFPYDGTISVFEKSKRNSGMVGGKYLERARWRKPAHEQGTDGEEKWYDGSSFALGQVLTLSGHPLKLTGADDYAIKYMKAHPEWFPST